jgi:putative transposase
MARRSGTYFYLYVVMDVYSRTTVAWMIATRETADLADAPLAEPIATEKVPRRPAEHPLRQRHEQASKTVALLLADRGVITFHSRARVSNDCPWREALLKTVKYQRALKPKLIDRRTQLPQQG